MSFLSRGYREGCRVQDHEKSFIFFSRIIERANKAWNPSKLYISTRTKYSRLLCDSKIFSAFLYTSQINSCVPRILLRGYRKCAKGDCKEIGNIRRRYGKPIVFTKSRHCNFRACWWVPVSRNLLGYSLFYFGAEANVTLCERHISSWSSCTNKYQESDEIGLVGVY